MTTLLPTQFDSLNSFSDLLLAPSISFRPTFV